MQAIELWEALSRASMSLDADSLGTLREAIACGEVASRQCDLELIDQLILLRGPLCDADPDVLRKPVTVLQVAEHRLGRPARTGEDFEAADLPLLGGCVCGASVAAYNACPSAQGVWMCLNNCIEGSGYDDVRTACRACGGCESCGDREQLHCPSCQGTSIARIGDVHRVIFGSVCIPLEKLGCECGWEWYEEVVGNK